MTVDAVISDTSNPELSGPTAEEIILASGGCPMNYFYISDDDVSDPTVEEFTSDPTEEEFISESDYEALIIHLQRAWDLAKRDGSHQEG